MSKSAHLIVVGKYKDERLSSLENEYLARLNQYPLKVHETKARADDYLFEAKEVIKKIQDISSQAKIIGLMENGIERDSVGFSQWFFNQLHTHNTVIFIISGAMGPHPDLQKQFHETLSLSKMTYAHKLARLVFIEQYYRGVTIKLGHPYHNS